MQVAFALFRYFPFGGMQRDMLTAAMRCQARGHTVSIYCYSWEGDRPIGIAVTVLKVTGSTNHVRARHFDRSLQQQLRQQQPDVVIGFDKLSGLDLYFAADPCFVTRTAERNALYRLLPRYRTLRNLEGAVFGSSATTQILLLDDHERDHYQRTWQTSSDRFALLPPGIAKDRLKGPDAHALRNQGRTEFGIGDQDKLVLLLAANFELKGLDRAMKAIADLPDKLQAHTHLLAVGQDPPKWLSRLAKRLGIASRVKMIAGRDDVPLLLQSADILIHPARRDTTGTVLLEAIAAGLPILCTDTCGYAKHVQAAGCGHVVGNWDETNSASKHLLSLLSKNTSSLQEAAVTYALQHDLHGMHDAICRAIEA